MDRDHIKHLLDRFKTRTASESEKALLELWYSQYKDTEGVEYQLADRLGDANEIWANLPVHGHSIKRIKLWPRIAIAAAAVVAIAFGIYFFTTNRYLDTSASRTSGRDLLNDIAPGKNGATITLGNGKVVELSNEKSGVVVGDGLKYYDGSDVRFSSGTSSSGSLKGSQNSSGPVGVHSLTPNSMMYIARTAKGQTYQFTLPDGTRVWLNADSKLEFPSNFLNSKTRNVKLSGEGYFEVVHNAKQPFKVESKGPDGRDQVVEDIGTAFNINAYSDGKSVKTTLLEGSASVNGKILKPNEQATLKDQQIKVSTVNAEEAISWKNGFFVFKSTTLESVLDQVERWYNVDVIYSSEALKKLTLSGSASRNSNVSVVLQAIENTGTAKFKINGRKITVLK